MAESRVQKARAAYLKSLQKSKADVAEAQEANAIMEVFEYCYTQSTSDLQRLQDFQNIYDNVVDEASWPTTSKVPIPLLFSMVEKALPDAFEGMFPTDPFVRLTPMERGVSIERVENAEFALHQTFMYRMRFPWFAIPTLKDCFKMGIGYGAIEPIVVTPPASFINTATQGDRTLKARTMGLGSPRRTIRYKHISPGQIIVSKDGSDFNGPHRVSHSFYFDSYTEQQFRDMYSDSAIDGEKPEVGGDVESIIAEARNLGFFTRTPIVEMIASLAGIDIAKANAEHRFPVRVPVLKMYTDHEHIWIANGTRIIYRAVDRYQTLYTPLLKCSAWPDGHRWYPMSAPEASQGMSLGTNLWVNSILDMMTHLIKPTMAYDKNLTGGKPPERGMNNEIGMAGPVRDAIHYLEQPRMDPALFGIGELLMRWYGTSVGQEEFLNRGSPGIVRGGMFAFESLLQSTTGRQKMATTILDLGFVEPALRQTLIQMQMNISDGPDTYTLRKYNKESGKEDIEYKTVTEEDMVNAFELSVNLREKMRNSAAEQQVRQGEFQNLRDDPYVDQWMLRKRYIGNSEDANRMLFSREESARIQDERRRAEEAAIASGAQQRPALPSTTTLEQATAGAGL